MTHPFGTIDAALRRIPTRRPRISPALVLGAVAQVATELQTPSLHIGVLDPFGPDPLLSVEEDERRTRIEVAELARDMERAWVADSPVAVRAAFRSWIDHRPVTDVQALGAGIAVCGWTDAASTTVTWQVVVHRRRVAMRWRPSPLLSATDCATARIAAQQRSQAVPVELRVAGATAIWTCRSAPELSTAALVAPERLLWQMSRRALPTEDIHVIVSPPRPFVCAPGPVARRLAGESSERHATLEWARFDALGWS